jgi:predicted ABC-type ATPase
LKNYELACARVLQRVENGGHNIPEEIIIRRFKKGRDNLKKYTYP